MKSARRMALIVMSLLVLGEGAAWLTAWHARRAAEGAANTPIVPVPQDSLPAASAAYIAASRRGDWEGALALQRRITAAMPGNPDELRQLALAVGNCCNATRDTAGGPRYLLRNSLVRVRWQREALAMLDSSAALTDDVSERERAGFWKARVLTSSGFPLDGLVEFARMLNVAPADSTVRVSIVSLKARLMSTQASPSR
ncbi:MAG TPA: hypothetical protein VMH61_02530 [Candidatus Acidoferrales bacterium]|nr:hypothetical protein [Candidatus Acidoferrales bacterium]